MAKIKTAEVRGFARKSKKKYPGVHAKRKFSRNKKSKLYKKISRGQG